MGIAINIVSIIVLLIVLLKLSISPLNAYFMYTEPDLQTGVIDLGDDQTLNAFYAGKRVLIVGGTRGVGLATAKAVASHGADMTVVGRSKKSGEAAVAELQSVAIAKEQKFEYLSYDLSTVKAVIAMTDMLKGGEKFDVIALTLGVFPDQENPVTEDGVEKAFATMVLARYIIFKEVPSILNNGGRILNVLVSGQKSLTNEINHDILLGKRIGDFIETIGPLGPINDIFLMEFAKIWSDNDIRLIGVHPGFLITDLHRDQGILFDILEPIVYSLIGITDEDCGINQANIIASPKITQKLTLVTDDRVARLPCPIIQEIAKKDKTLIFDHLESLIAKHK